MSPLESRGLAYIDPEAALGAEKERREEILGVVDAVVDLLFAPPIPEDKVTVGAVAVDTLASIAAHKLPVPTSAGVFAYGVAKHADQTAMEATAGGVAHLVLDTCVEGAFERLTERAIHAGVAAMVLKPFIPVSSVVPAVVGAHVVRICASVMQKYLPKDPDQLLTHHLDPDHFMTVEEGRALLEVLSSPSHALEGAHHFIAHKMVQGLHAAGVKDQHIDALMEGMKVPLRMLGAVIAAPDGGVAEAVGAPRILPRQLSVIQRDLCRSWRHVDPMESLEYEMREAAAGLHIASIVVEPMAIVGECVARLAEALIMAPLSSVVKAVPEAGIFLRGLTAPFVKIGTLISEIPGGAGRFYGFSREEQREVAEDLSKLGNALLAYPFLRSLTMPKGFQRMILDVDQNAKERFCHAVKYGARDSAFAEIPREFNGVLSRDLTVVRFGADVGDCGKGTVWWTPPAEINPLATMEAFTEKSALLSRFGEKTHVVLARIPAGERVRFLYGRAASQVDVVTGEVKQGGMVQYQFYDFDLNWVREGRPLLGLQSKSLGGGSVKSPFFLKSVFPITPPIDKGLLFERAHESPSSILELRIQPPLILDGRLGVIDEDFHRIPLPGHTFIYPIRIVDGKKSTYTEDPLPYLIKHIDRLRDLKICIETSKDVVCRDISLPPAMRQNILNFLRRHRSLETWHCAHFAAASQGEYNEQPCKRKHEKERCHYPELSVSHWDVEIPKELDEQGFQGGDFLAYPGWPSGHAFVALGRGFYFGKNGLDEGLIFNKMKDVNPFGAPVIRYIRDLTHPVPSLHPTRVYRAISSLAEVEDPTPSELILGQLTNKYAERMCPKPYFSAYFCEGVKSGARAKKMAPKVSHAAGDRITAKLNQEPADTLLNQALRGEIEWLKGYVEEKKKGDLTGDERRALRTALADGEMAARRFGCPRLSLVFAAGQRMMAFQEAAEHVNALQAKKGTLCSLEGAEGLFSLASIGASMVTLFAGLDTGGDSGLGALQEQMKEYTVALSHQVQGLCDLTVRHHEVEMWEFARARYEIALMRGRLEALHVDILEGAGEVRAAVAIGFDRLARQMGELGEEVDYRIQELQVERLRKVEDGLNHYVRGEVSLDRLREWAGTLERWIESPPAKELQTGVFYAKTGDKVEYIKRSAMPARLGLLAHFALAKGLVAFDEGDLKALVNLDTVEPLLPAYLQTLQYLKEAGVTYDPRGLLWQEKVRAPLAACERVAILLEAKSEEIARALYEELKASYKEGSVEKALEAYALFAALKEHVKGSEAVGEFFHNLRQGPQFVRRLMEPKEPLPSFEWFAGSHGMKSGTESAFMQKLLALRAEAERKHGEISPTASEDRLAEGIKALIAALARR